MNELRNTLMRARVRRWRIEYEAYVHAFTHAVSIMHEPALYRMRGCLLGDCIAIATRVMPRSARRALRARAQRLVPEEERRIRTYMREACDSTHLQHAAPLHYVRVHDYHIMIAEHGQAMLVHRDFMRVIDVSCSLSYPAFKMNTHKHCLLAYDTHGIFALVRPAALPEGMLQSMRKELRELTHCSLLCEKEKGDLCYE